MIHEKKPCGSGGMEDTLQEEGGERSTFTNIHAPNLEDKLVPEEKKREKRFNSAMAPGAHTWFSPIGAFCIVNMREARAQKRK